MKSDIPQQLTCDASDLILTGQLSGIFCVKSK
jgi:hypothetical protein